MSWYRTVGCRCATTIADDSLGTMRLERPHRRITALYAPSHWRRTYSRTSSAGYFITASLASGESD